MGEDLNAAFIGQSRIIIPVASNWSKHHADKQDQSRKHRETWKSRTTDRRSKLRHGKPGCKASEWQFVLLILHDTHSKIRAAQQQCNMGGFI